MRRLSGKTKLILIASIASVLASGSALGLAIYNAVTDPPVHSGNMITDESNNQSIYQSATNDGLSITPERQAAKEAKAQKDKEKTEKQESLKGQPLYGLDEFDSNG